MTAMRPAGRTASAASSRLEYWQDAEAPADPAVAAVAPPPAPPPAPAADPQPAAEAPGDLASRLSHDQLLKLADADRAREAKLAAPRRAEL